VGRADGDRHGDQPSGRQWGGQRRDPLLHRQRGGTAEDDLHWVRGPWGIENALHWVLDVCFREDDPRHWADNSAENLAWMRKLALCLLEAEKNSKGKRIATRRLLAGWKNDSLLSVLAQIPENSGA
jgi:hypothetical protein